MDCSKDPTTGDTYPTNNGGPRNGTTWVEGNNHVAFRNVIADSNGKILFTANENCAPHLLINGFQLVAAGAPTPEATDITYGQLLSASTLGGTFVNAAGATVPGTLAFTNPTMVPPVGTAAYSVTFTPTDTANYNLGSAMVNVTVTAPTDPFLAWINDKYPDLSDKTPTGDPDGDGMSNHAEYAFGLDPSSGSSCSPIKTLLDKTTGTFIYTRRATPATTLLVYKVWTSEDLVSPWTEDVDATEIVTGLVGDVQTVEVTLSAAKPLAASKLFMRVTAE